MSRLEWDKDGERLYESGVKNGVLYVREGAAYPKGVAWNGLMSVNENPSGAEATKLYANDSEYLQIMSKETWGGTIGAYTYPDEFAECDGSEAVMDGATAGQQARKTFGFAYETSIGNDTDGATYGRKITVVYGCLAKPSQRDRKTQGENIEPLEMSWEISSTPVSFTKKDGTVGKTSTFTFDSTKMETKAFKAVEDILFGAEESDAKLELPDALIAAAKAAAAHG